MTQSILAPPVATSVMGPWPRRWPDQRALLERQHDRLESLLAVLIDDHESNDVAIEVGLQQACRKLLWNLRLHLRLEERWLQQHRCLCSGHRQSHREVLIQASATLMAVEQDRQGRLALLESIQAWFLAHRHGPDALAYALAAQSCTGD